LTRPTSVPRSASAARQLSRWSSDFIPGFERNCTTLGARATLTTAVAAHTVDSLAYSLYEFNSAGAGGSLSVEVNVNQAFEPGGTLYVGLADFAADRWTWFPHPGAGTPLVIPEPAPYVDADGRVLLAVLLFADGQQASVQLDYLSLTFSAGADTGPVFSDLHKISRIEFLQLADGRQGLFIGSIGPDYERDTTYFYFCASTDASATAWQPPQLIAELPMPAEALRIPLTLAPSAVALIDGRPAIAYIEQWAGDGVLSWTMYYAVARDAAGTDWAPAVRVDGKVESEVPLLKGLLDVGVPAVTYSRYSQPYYRRADVPGGSVWRDEQQMYAHGEITAPLLLEGQPAFFVTAQTPAFTDSISLFRAADEYGDTWQPPQAVFEGELDNRIIAGMVLADGRPAFHATLREVVDGELERKAIFHCADTPAADSWPQAPQYFEAQELKWTPLLGMPGGRPLIFDELQPSPGGAVLLWSRALDAGAETWSPQYSYGLPDDLYLGAYDLTVAAGVPVLAIRQRYVDQYDELRILHLPEASQL
jgi:hypothetical protein